MPRQSLKIIHIELMQPRTTTLNQLTNTCEFFPPVLKIGVSASFEQEVSHVEGGGGGEGGEAVVERGVPVITCNCRVFKFKYGKPRLGESTLT